MIPPPLSRDPAPRGGTNAVCCLESDRGDCADLTDAAAAAAAAVGGVSDLVVGCWGPEGEVDGRGAPEEGLLGGGWRIPKGLKEAKNAPAGPAGPGQ